MFAGEGVEQDYAKAFHYYDMAAHQDNALAKYNLGLCYYYGYGVAQDIKSAKFWLGKALQSGKLGGREAQWVEKVLDE